MAEGGGPEAPPLFSEPEARYFSCAAAIGDHVFMYRGYLKSYLKKLRVSPPSRCEVFDTKTFQWEKHYSQGPNPKAWQSSSVAVFKHRLFFYGGWSGRDYTNELFELDTLATPMKWVQHKPKNPKKGPMRKEGCGVVSLPGGEELCMFGGYGVPVGRAPQGNMVLQDEKYRDGRGWTNELHCYHLAEATWRCPEQIGQRPQPSVAMTFIRVDARRIVMFAGYNRGERRRVNEVHILDVTIWHWSGVIMPQGISQRWPEGRCYHTAYSLWDPDSEPENPSLVVTCGWSEDAQPLGDLWVFQVNSKSWEELKLPGSSSLVPRLNHAGGLVHVSATKRLLVTNGGIPEDTNLFKSVKEYPIISDTVVSELVYSEEATASGSCGWSVASVMKSGSKVMKDGIEVIKGQDSAPTSGKQISKEDEDQALDKKLEREFELKEKLGEGGFGVVYRAINRLDGGEYALKMIKLPTGKAQRETVMQEVHALKKLDHPRIMRYFQSWPARLQNKEVLESFGYKDSPNACGEFSTYHLSDAETDSSTPSGAAKGDSKDGNGKEPRAKFPSCLFIQMQLCRKSTLRDWLLSTVKDRPKEQVFSYFEQILEAVKYIHHRGLLHRDLKPSNIFFSQEDGNIKVGDFGLVAGNLSLEPSSKQQTHSGQVGTWFYMAPEQLLPEKYDQKVDIFALGVIFLEMNYPLTAKERLQVHSVLRSKFEPPEAYTKEFPKEAAFMKELLNPVASKRPSAEVVSGKLQALKATLGITFTSHGQVSSSGLHLPLIEERMPSKTISSGSQKQEESGFYSRTHDASSAAEGVTVPRQLSAGGHKEDLDITESGIAEDSQTHSRFPGIRFLSGSPWSTSVTSQAQTTPWAEEIGISFDIPEGAVPSGEQLSLSVWPCVSGPFIPPPGYELASPVFIVGPKFKFKKEILLHMAHYIELQSHDDCQKMAFLSAPSTPQTDKGGKPAYHFKVSRRGSFQVSQSNGTLSLSHFCLKAVGKEANAGGQVRYSVQLHQSAMVQRAYFTVSIVNNIYKKNLEAFLQQQHPGVTFERSVKQPVQFARAEVTLDIPTDSMSGWMVVADKSPSEISRNEVDDPLCPSGDLDIDYPPKLQLTLIQQNTPRKPCRPCDLSIGGLTESWSFKLKLWKATDLAASRQLPSVTVAGGGHTSEITGPLSPVSPVTPISPANANGNLGNDKILGQGDLVDITEYLHPIVDRRDVRSLGLVLGLHLDRLRAIEQISDDFLDDVIAAWLRKEGDVEQRGGPRWSTLVKALQHRRLKQTGIARTIAVDKGLQTLMQQ